MAHILFISPYYPPENGAAPACVGETCTRLVKLGHQVTVLTTFPNYPTGVVAPEYRGHLFQEEMRDGVRVVRVWSWVSPNKSFLHRIKWYLSFAFLAPLLGGKAVGHPAIIIVQSPPLFDAITVRILARWKRCPFIFMVSDLWPEAPIQLGVLRNPVLIRLSKWLEWSTYQRASLVWVVTEWIRDKLIQRGLAPEHILLLTNGVDINTFHPLPQAKARAELEWDDRFTILYVGTHGVTHGLMTIIDAADQIRDHNDIHFVLVGEGSDKEDMIAETHKRGLTNVTFMDVVPHSLVPTLLAAGDACLAHVRKASVTEGIIPVKMYEAMACARPVVLAVEGDARRIAEEAGAAICVEPENANALAAAILHLREHPDLASSLGLKGRAYVEARFDYDHLTAVLEVRIVTLLDELNISDSHSKKKYKQGSLSRIRRDILNLPELSEKRAVKVASISSLESPTQFHPNLHEEEKDLTFDMTGSSAFNSITIGTDITHNPSCLSNAFKRLFDIALATFGIVVLLPVFLIIAVCIKLEDGGDILYFREMIGLGGRRFMMLKFRTMILNADAYLEQHPELKLAYQENMKLQCDPRITQLGRFLRKAYLDELPQLFNVVVGQMSLVGPRAIHESELILYGEHAEKRHSVKPGITGLWQISPNRYKCYEDRIPLDMRYIDNRSFFLDLVTLLKTLKIFINPTGV